MDMADHRRTSVDPPDYSDKSSFSSDEKLEEETLLRQFNGGVMHMRKKSRWINLTSRRLLIINLVLSTFSTVALVTSTVLWYTGHHAKDTKDPLPPSPAIGVIEKELRPFSLTSPYIAPPGVVTDQLWRDLVNTGAIFPLTLEEFVEVNDSPETGIQLTHDPHGRYVGTLASTHQIHCVDALRKGLWFHYEYYRDHGDDIFMDEDPVEDHLMHCVEMLRNAIMCSGDVSVITYNWKKGHAAPKASFKSMHSCQKWDKIEEWRSAHNVTSQINVLERPVGLLDEAPEATYPDPVVG
ncbi:hypothetical protein MGN70_010383 [Eutypa lata]|nr:hypothetical protein MGN70_010383 [Eutypa lata]